MTTTSTLTRTSKYSVSPMAARFCFQCCHVVLTSVSRPQVTEGEDPRCALPEPAAAQDEAAAEPPRVAYSRSASQVLFVDIPFVVSQLGLSVTGLLSNY